MVMIDAFGRLLNPSQRGFQNELPTPQVTAETCYTEQELRALDPRVVQQEGGMECMRKGTIKPIARRGGGVFTRESLEVVTCHG
jgi:hypothetical protein